MARPPAVVVDDGCDVQANAEDEVGGVDDGAAIETNCVSTEAYAVRSKVSVMPGS